MANQTPSPYPILCASFNQDNSCFAICTKDTLKVFDASTGKLFYQRVAGAFAVVEMLYGSDLLVIVGAGEHPCLSPRRLCLFNTTTGEAMRILNFVTSILAVRLNKKRLVVVQLEQIVIYDSNRLEILDTIDTVPNPKGLCAFSPCLDGCLLAVPASTMKGSVLVYNVMDLQSHSEIDAHRSPLAAIALSSNGMYIATASEQGTIIRVHLVSEATKSCSFRRGTYPSAIFSLSFGPSLLLPDILIATSSSGSIHAFSLSLAISQRNKRSGSLLGSVLPDSLTKALDPAHHHILHYAVSAGVRSHAVVRKIIKGSSPAPDSAAFEATISMIKYDGYFQEYTFTVNNQNQSKWSLEHEFNLLSASST